MTHTKMLIIGSGPAGLTAAIYAARAMITPMIVAGGQPGGQLTITTDVENYPGFADPVQGPELMEEMRKQAIRYGTHYEEDIVTEIDTQVRPFKAKLMSDKVITADTVIISTGAQAKWLGLASEDKYKGFGVSACATCDGFFYRNKGVAVVGGGNTAVEEALFLTNFASKVYLFHRRDTLRAEQLLQERLFAHEKIVFMPDMVTEEILGQETPFGVNGIRMRNTKTGEISDYAVDGVFIAIGHKPNTDIFRDHLDMDDEGYIKVSKGTVNSSVPGIYAPGDVSDKIYRQAVTAAGMGCMAALDAARYLETL
ncbi:MAG: thioredoxin-disulfide reductase [Pseudomonadota bacterium]